MPTLKKTNTSSKRAVVEHERVVIPHIITYSEAARLANVSVPTIIRWVQDGGIKVFRSPGGGAVRVHADSLAAYIERNSVGGPK